MSSRLRWQHNPLRLVGSEAPWVATVYLASYLPVGILLFGGVLAVLVFCSVLNVTWLGLPLLVGAAAVVRGAAQLERRRAALIGEEIAAAYADVAGKGLFGRVRERWKDRATRRDCLYLVGLFLPLLLLDLVSLVLWLASLAGVLLPLWFWAVPQRLPDGTHFKGVRFGSVLIDTVPMALLTALCCAVLALGTGYLVVAAARVHAAVARYLLGPWVDPLAEAKRVLAEPGPLTV